MGAEFSFEIDRPRSLVRIKMAGFFMPEDVRAFLEARQEAHAALECAPNAHLTLNDIREMNIQPQETVDAFQALLAAPESRSRLLAFVVGPTLARSQVLRALETRVARCFTDPSAAEAWLFAEDAETAPSAGSVDVR